MIKYADLAGYNNYGEIQIFSHLYQFVEKYKETPMIIIIHAYECATKIFKGFVCKSTKTYQSVELTKEEIDTLEQYVGTSTQVNFDAFIVGTILEESFKDYKDLDKEQ